MDIMVNGTSVASGWGNGKEDLTGFNNTSSWPHFFANMSNASRLWNHSLPSKPLELVIRDQYRFCDQYMNAGNSPDNLFCMVELGWPSYPDFIQVDDRSRQLFPVFFKECSSDQSIYCNNTWWSDFIVSSPHDPDYLSGSVYEADSVTGGAYRVICSAKSKIMYQNTFNERMNKICKKIRELSKWLDSYNFSFIIFWGANEIPGVVDQQMTTSLGGHKHYIPMRDFSTLLNGVAWSKSPKRNHPDLLGSKRIAKYLFEQTTRKQLWPRAQLIQV